MAKKKYYKRKNKFSVAEKQSYKRGFLAGLLSAKGKKKKKTSANTKKSALLDKIKMYRKRNLGVLYYNGKYYDTNFIDKPHEIPKSFIKDLHKEYDFDGKRSDIEVADSYVRHMRRKYGSFDLEGNFLGMLGE